MKYIVYILFMSCITWSLSAQENWQSKSVDDIFLLARGKAINGSREEARLMLHYVLSKSPDYHDVRILLGRTYAWDGRREEARRAFRHVLQKDTKHEDALSALIDVEMWDEMYDEALKLVIAALQIYPNHEDFLFKRAHISYNLKNIAEAMVTLNQLLKINPTHEAGLVLFKSIKTDQLKYNVVVAYNIDIFSRNFDPAHYASAQLGRTNRWGSSIIRFNYTHRFNTDGFQPEVDLYPKIAKGVYAYLNYGYSATDLFPEHRGGAEIFSKLPKSLEASAGLRYLVFDSDTKVTIFTGSLGWYFKSYWLSVRPYITPNKETGTSISTAVSIRKYFASIDHFIGLSMGIGFSPDERRFQSGTGFTSDGIYTLKSQRMGVVWNQTLPNNFILTTTLDLQRQELIFDEGNFVLMSSMGIGLRKRF